MVYFKISFLLLTTILFMTNFSVLNNLSLPRSLPPNDADGHGYPFDAVRRVCPTCRGIGRVSARYTLVI